jgi:hypothetical protein
MPTLIKRTRPSQEVQPEFFYHFELNKLEKIQFFNEFLKGFFDPNLLGDLEMRETTVEFTMKMYKKVDTEDIGAE